MSTTGLIAIQIGIMFSLVFIHFIFLGFRIDEIIANQELIINLVNGTALTECQEAARMCVEIANG